MEPLQFLFVSVENECRTRLIHSLQGMGYSFELCEVQNKKQALEACYQAKYDILITKEELADGGASDLINALSGLMPCLVVRSDCSAKQATMPPSTTMDFSYLPHNEYEVWGKYLADAIAKWENDVMQKLNALQESRRTLYDRVAAACAAQLCEHHENRIENTLKIILDVLQVSKVYLRTDSSKRHQFTHEVHALGHRFAETYQAVYEVAIQRPDGRTEYLGIVECLYHRTWQKAEIDLLKRIAILFQDNRSKVRGKINFYPELGLTA